MQCDVNTTIEEEVFSMGLPRDYISGTEFNEEIEKENENGASPW
jgi:hypothetical protein